MLYIYSNTIPGTTSVYMGQKLFKIVNVYQNPNKYYEPGRENVAAKDKNKRSKYKPNTFQFTLFRISYLQKPIQLVCHKNQIFIYSASFHLKKLKALSIPSHSSILASPKTMVCNQLSHCGNIQVNYSLTHKRKGKTRL